jgi:hypothetical protein
MKPRKKKCKACKQLFQPFNSLAKACGVECSLVLARSEKAKKVAAAEKAEKAEVRKAKKQFKENDTKHLKALAQKTFNAFIRERDKDECCISCDKPRTWTGGLWHAGHYLTTGAKPQLRFNELNVNKQCSQCNLFLSGNVAVYKVRLENKIGKAAVEALENDNTKANYRAEDYRQIIQTYRQKLKELKNGA